MFARGPPYTLTKQRNKLSAQAVHYRARFHSMMPCRDIFKAQKKILYGFGYLNILCHLYQCKTACNFHIWSLQNESLVNSLLFSN